MPRIIQATYTYWNPRQKTHTIKTYSMQFDNWTEFRNYLETQVQIFNSFSEEQQDKFTSKIRKVRFEYDGIKIGMIDYFIEFFEIYVDTIDDEPNEYSFSDVNKVDDEIFNLYLSTKLDWLGVSDEEH